MGKLQHDPVINHFSHPHPLRLVRTQQASISDQCGGCKLQPSDWIYTCNPCSYILHVSCSQMPQLINHPSDLDHPLSLLTRPAYPEGYFNCNACGRHGDGFSYHCAPCDVDVHIQCASMPLSLAHPAHHHPLSLAFFPPYRNKGFSCDICRNLGSNHWLYRCNACGFDAHLGCATAKPQPAVQQQAIGVQQFQSQARALPQQFQTARGGTGSVCQQLNYSQAAGLPMPMPQRNQPLMMTNGHPTNQQMMMMNGPQANRTMMMMNGPQANQPIAMKGQGSSALVDQIIQGFIGGATQQMGQNIVQSIMGAGGGGDS